MKGGGAGAVQWSRSSSRSLSFIFSNPADGQRFFESGTGALKARLHRPHIYFKKGSNFGQRHFFVVREKQDLALLLGKLSHSVGDEIAQFVAQEFRLGRLRGH